MFFRLAAVIGEGRKGPGCHDVSCFVIFGRLVLSVATGFPAYRS